MSPWQFFVMGLHVALAVCGYILLGFALLTFGWCLWSKDEPTYRQRFTSGSSTDKGSDNGEDHWRHG